MRKYCGLAGILLFWGPGLAQDELHRWVFPWVSSNAQYESILVLNNWGHESVTVSLKALRGPNPTGRAESASVELSLPPFGFVERRIDDLFPDMGQGSGMCVVASSGSETISGGWVTNNLLAASGRSPSQGNALELVAGDGMGQTLLYGFLPLTNGLTSAPVVINCHETAQDVELIFTAESGEVVASQVLSQLAPFKPFASIANSLVSGSQAAVSLTVRGSLGPLCGAAFIFNASNEPSIANAIALQTEENHTRLVFPWVSSNQNFESIVFINNPGLEEATLNLTARRANGETASASRKIAAGGFLSQLASQIFPALGQGAGFTLEAVSELKGLQGGWVTNNLTTASGRSPSQGNAVPIPEDGGDRVNCGADLIFRYLPVQDGMTSAPVVVLLEAEPEDVDLYFFDAAGTCLASKRLANVEPLRPFAEVVNSLAGSDTNVYCLARCSGRLAGASFVFNAGREPAIGNASSVDPKVQPGYASLAQAMIGTAGGSLKTADFEADIPARCFSSEYSLAVWGPGPLFLAKDEATGFYLTGLPSQFSSAISTRLRPAQESRSFSVSTFGNSSELKRTIALPNARDFIQQGEWLASSIVPPGSSAKSANVEEPQVLQVTMLTASAQYSKVSAGGHFRLSWWNQEVSETQVDHVAAALEEAYSYFKGLGFSYSARSSWPASVDFIKMNDSLFGMFGEPALGYNYGVIRLNSKKAANTKEMGITAFHEFFHMVQTFYHPDPAILRIFRFPDWFDEATAAWSEEKYSESGAGHVPDNVRDNGDAIGAGVQYGATHGGRDYKDHGYGMASYIKYCLQNLAPGGAKELVKTYEDIKTGRQRLVAFRERFSAAPDSHFDDFASSLAAGQIYGLRREDMPRLPALAVPSGVTAPRQFEFRHGPIDGLRQFPDLSLDLFDVKFPKTGFDDSHLARFRVLNGDETANAHLFTYVTGKDVLSPLGLSGQDILLGRINRFSSANQILSALVTWWPSIPNFGSTRDLRLQMTVRSIVFEFQNQESAMPIHILKPGEAFNPQVNRITPGSCRCTTLGVELSGDGQLELRAGRNGQVLATASVNVFYDASNNGEDPLAPLLVKAIWDGSNLGVFYETYISGWACNNCPKDGNF